MDQMVAILTQLRPAIQRLAGGGYDGEDLYGNVALACVEKAEHYDWTHPQIRTRVLRIARNLNIRRIRKERSRRHHILLSVLSAEHPGLATLECMEAESDGRFLYRMASSRSRARRTVSPSHPTAFFRRKTFCCHRPRYEHAICDRPNPLPTRPAAACPRPASQGVGCQRGSLVVY
jgi:hypothetical protein